VKEVENSNREIINMRNARAKDTRQLCFAAALLRNVYMIQSNLEYSGNKYAKEEHSSAKQSSEQNSLEQIRNVFTANS
jgi:hypothetical protein